MRRTTITTALMVAAGLALGACGDDKPRLTQAEFVTQGNAICKASNDRIDAAADKAFAGATDQNPPTPAQFGAFATATGIPEIEKQLDAIDDLKSPKAVQDKVEEALKEARRVIRKAKANPAALADEADTMFDKADALIAAAGLNVCGEEA